MSLMQTLMKKNGMKKMLHKATSTDDGQFDDILSSFCTINVFL